MPHFSRRDFLKLGLKFFETSLASHLISNSSQKYKTTNSPNVIVLVCDAMSARNLSLYGYPRKTTPNLEKLANQAFVYHNHYANGNFTTPGTASLLTGLRPWTHRAINFSGIVKKELSQHNIFHFLGNHYFKLAYAQNLLADHLLNQFSSDINTLLPFSEFGLTNAGAINQKFKKDAIIANHAIDRMLFYGNSLLLSFLYGLYYQLKIDSIPSNNYPLGLPTANQYDRVFTVENLFEEITNQIFELDKLESPFFSYFHIYPPHTPYAPNKDFAGIFDNDGYTPVEKREHVLSEGVSQATLESNRNMYDAFLANIDMEIGRLITRLKEQGVLDNTYFIITSDHGEMFERNTDGHVTALMYEPVIKIPLMILVPGNQTRRDFSFPTSAIDLMPTILNIAGQDIPTSIEGTILPGFGGVEESNQNIICMEAKESNAHQPFTKVTYTVIKGNYKLIYYYGYVHKYQNHFEFYDLQEDPEELNDKYGKPKFEFIISDMKSELFTAINIANRKL